MMNTAHNTPGKFAIFKAGTHTSADGRVVTMSVEDLMQIAQAYDPSHAAAPLVVGHPELDMPAYGWVARLSVEGDELVAETRDVAAEFAAMVNKKRFPNRSAAIFLEQTPGNPRPGKKYLKHVGFLGAVPPAIPGLKPVTFSADDGMEHKALYFNFPLTYEKDLMMDKEALEAQQKALEKKEADLNAREAALKAQELEAEREAAVNFAAKLADEGKLLPAEVNGIAELLIQLPNNQALTFSAAGTQVTKAPADFMKEFLNGLPNRVNYGEKSADVSMEEKPLQFSAPQGVQVDSSRTDLYQKALAYQHQHTGVSFEEAVMALGG